MWRTLVQLGGRATRAELLAAARGVVSPTVLAAIAHRHRENDRHRFGRTGGITRPVGDSVERGLRDWVTCWARNQMHYGWVAQETAENRLFDVFELTTPGREKAAKLGFSGDEAVVMKPATPVFPKPVGRKGKATNGKRKRTTRQRLIDRLDRACSDFVRRRDDWTCVTCGRRDPFSQHIHAGHFIPRGHLIVRWDERNVHAQCFTCNRPKRGMGYAYAAFIVRQYGAEELARLDAARHQTWKPTLDELRALLTKFTEAENG